MDSELLDLLVCPKTKKKLVQAPADVLEQLNKKIQSGSCVDISGEKVAEPVQEALFEPENRVVYVIRDDIPILIYENGIVLPPNK